MSHIQLRRANLEDIDEIVETIEMAFKVNLLELETEQILRDLSDKKNIYLANLEEKTIAFIESTHKGNTLHVDLIAVKPEYQGQRIGSRLMYWNIAKYQSTKQIEEITLQYHTKEVKEFYKKFGFEDHTDPIKRNGKILRGDTEEVLKAIKYLLDHSNIKGDYHLQ